MNRIFKALLMLLAFLVAFSVAAPAANATWTKTRRIDRGSVTFPGGEYVQFSVIYNHYYQAGSYARVKPKRVIVAYNMPGTHMTCDPILRKYDGINANFLFWRPYTGANYNPPKFHIPCDESTQNSEVQVFENAPKLRFGPGHGSDRQPKWSALITLQRNGDWDQMETYRTDFKPLS